MDDRILRRMELIKKRNEEAKKNQVRVEGGSCENGKACIGPLCNKWDRLAEQCSIRSVGEAATILLDTFGPQIMSVQDDRENNENNP